MNNERNEGFFKKIASKFAEDSRARRAGKAEIALGKEYEARKKTNRPMSIVETAERRREIAQLQTPEEKSEHEPSHYRIAQKALRKEAAERENAGDRMSREEFMGRMRENAKLMTKAEKRAGNQTHSGA